MGEEKVGKLKGFRDKLFPVTNLHLVKPILRVTKFLLFYKDPEIPFLQLHVVGFPEKRCVDLKNIRSQLGTL